MFNKMTVRHLIISSLLIVYVESNSGQYGSHIQLPRSADVQSELKSGESAASNYPAINSRIKTISGPAAPVDKLNLDENLLVNRAFNYLPPTLSTILGGNAYPNSLFENNGISAYGGGNNVPSISAAPSITANIPSGHVFNGLAAPSIGRSIYNYLFGNSPSQNPLSGLSLQSIQPSLGSNIAGWAPQNIQSPSENIYNSKLTTSSYVVRPPSQSNLMVQAFDGSGYPSIPNLPYSGNNVYSQQDQVYQPSPYGSLAYNQGYNINRSPVPVIPTSYSNSISRNVISGPINRAIATYIQRNPDVLKIISEFLPLNSLLNGVVSDQIPRLDTVGLISERTDPTGIFRSSPSVDNSEESQMRLL